MTYIRPLLSEALAALKYFGLIPDFVNENCPDRVKKYGYDARKIAGDFTIDDRAGMQPFAPHFLSALDTDLVRIQTYLQRHLDIVVDFDGTLFTEDLFPNIGKPNMPLIKYLIDKQQQGHRIFLNTLREDPNPQWVQKFIENNFESDPQPSPSIKSTCAGGRCRPAGGKKETRRKDQ